MRPIYRKLGWASAVLLCAIIAVAGALFRRDARLWPFATGTQEQAFLGTTFKMSPPEVRRALKKDGAKLVTYDSYRGAQPEPAITQLEFEFVFAEDRAKETLRYMPAIEMYGAKAEAEFVFWEEQLNWVNVYFVPISKPAESVVAAVEEKLRGKYKFLDREESKWVPGAYSLHFGSGDVRSSLWVNLSNAKKPVISVVIASSWREVERRRQIKEREETALGARKTHK